MKTYRLLFGFIIILFRFTSEESFYRITVVFAYSKIRFAVILLCRVHPHVPQKLSSRAKLVFLMAIPIIISLQRACGKGVVMSLVLEGQGPNLESAPAFWRQPTLHHGPSAFSKRMMRDPGIMPNAEFAPLHRYCRQSP